MFALSAASGFVLMRLNPQFFPILIPLGLAAYVSFGRFIAASVESRSLRKLPGEKPRQDRGDKRKDDISRRESIDDAIPKSCQDSVALMKGVEIHDHRSHRHEEGEDVPKFRSKFGCRSKYDVSDYPRPSKDAYNEAENRPGFLIGQPYTPDLGGYFMVPSGFCVKRGTSFSLDRIRTFSLGFPRQGGAIL